MTEFRLDGPLPLGTTVIEASAGTGKTYVIAGLAARYIAEGVTDVAHLMLVTFGRAATAELRHRARDRFLVCEAALADPATARESRDRVIAHLAAADDDEVQRRRQRLRRALSDFDTATIVTTHSFCQRMLDGVGLVGDYEPAAAVPENSATLLTEVTDDVYAARFCGEEGAELTMRIARDIAQNATDTPEVPLLPEAAADSVAGRRVEFAAGARAELARRKRASSQRDYNDLLLLLRDALADPSLGSVAAQRIRDRYRVVLADEFQDTDPLQWEILRRSFHGHIPLIMVGDPKQAIYGFRGADVTTYLDAAAVAGAPWELSGNRRSDRPLLDALHHLYGGAALGDDAITVHPVDTVHDESRMPGTAPLRVRYLSRAAGGSDRGYPSVAKVRVRVAADVADDIVATLQSGTLFHEKDEEPPRPVRPSDIAVLVRTRDQGALVRDALLTAEVPCVLTGGSSVFATASAVHWRHLLGALEHPHRAAWLRLASLTPLVGHIAAELADGGDALLAQLSSRIRGWSALLSATGPVAMFEKLSADTDLAARMLGLDGGERLLTDLRHLALLLDRAADSEDLGVTALGRWLDDRIDSERFTDTADRGRLLDREAAATRILTIHTAKGLEYPVVYLPYAWDRGTPDMPETLRLHSDGHRVLDVGGSSDPGYDDRLSVARREDSGEDLRLFYVAASRAQCRVVLWWAATRNTGSASAHRLLFGRTAGSAHPADRPPVPADADLDAVLQVWAAPAGAGIAVETVPADPAGARWIGDVGPQLDLAVARFTRTLRRDWRRISYTALTRTAHEQRPEIASEAEEPGIADEPDDAPAQTGPGEGIPSLFHGLGAGSAFGTLVHTVLEHVDVSAADLAAEVGLHCRRAAARSLLNVDADALAAAVTAVLHTPTPHGALADIGAGDRLAEVDFELPLAGASDGGPASTLVGIADLLEAHLSAGDPLAGYAARLRGLPDTILRGYLTGSLDAVLRVVGPRFVVVDYKTNRIGDGAHADDYDKARMREAMLAQHYPLQALLYSVALHRYLRWRLPGYDPAAHLGGVMYLFVRGMVGPTTPPGVGVFDWAPPPLLVTQLSDRLAGR